VEAYSHGWAEASKIAPRRVSMKTLVLFGLCVLTANAAEFARAKASADSTGNLVVSWRETGLDPGQQYGYEASAEVTATYWCLETGVRHPTGLALDAVTSQRFASPSYFTASNSGTISGELELSPPPPEATCPDGYRRVLHDVTYRNVVLVELVSPLTVEIPGEYSVLMFGKTVGAAKRLPTY
jgi:hypothetical protein